MELVSDGDLCQKVTDIKSGKSVTHGERLCQLKLVPS